MSLVILVPMLGRPQTVAPLLESIRATCDAAVHFLVTTNLDEGIGVDVIDAIREHGDMPDRITVTVPRQRGDYAWKINLGIRESTEEHIFTGACDLRFHPGWYEAACAKMVDGIGVVGTNDLTNPRTFGDPHDHATHMLVARWYADLGTIDGQPGFFYEGYPHEFVDDEAVATAKKRGAYAHAADSWVEHMHPMVGKARTDATYDAAPRRMREGRPIYLRRSRLWK